MKVIVCGAGQVGINIARQLAAEGNDVTILDQSEERIRSIADTLDVQTLVGHAADPDALEIAGAKDADMLIAVTFADEVNMVACQVAHSLFNVPTKIARIRRQSFLKAHWGDLYGRNQMPIDVIISPESKVATAIMRRLETPGAFDMVPFADGRIRALGIRLEADCPVLATPLKELTELFPGLSARVVGLIRDDEAMAADADVELQAGDEIYVVADRNHVERTLAAFGHEETEARRIVIVGAGNVGLFLAHDLEAQYANARIKVIEIDREQAEIASDQLKKTVVLNGDALQQEILTEANVQDAEVLIAVANHDEVNILSSLLAKRAGCRRVIALVNNPSYSTLVTSLGVDVVVDPREMTVSTILQHVRRGRVRELHSLRDGAAEIIEADALETSNLVGKAVRDIELPKSVIFGAIARGTDEVIIPTGDTVIQAKDRIVVFCLAADVRHVEQIFSVHLEFF